MRIVSADGTSRSVSVSALDTIGELRKHLPEEEVYHSLFAQGTEDALDDEAQVAAVGQAGALVVFVLPRARTDRFLFHPTWHHSAIVISEDRRTCTMPTDGVNGIAVLVPADVAPDGPEAAAGLADGATWAWSIQQGQRNATARGCNAVGVMKSGRVQHYVPWCSAPSNRTDTFSEYLDSTGGNLYSFKLELNGDAGPSAMLLARQRPGDFLRRHLDGRFTITEVSPPEFEPMACFQGQVAQDPGQRSANAWSNGDRPVVFMFFNSSGTATVVDNETVHPQPATPATSPSSAEKPAPPPPENAPPAPAPRENKRYGTPTRTDAKKPPARARTVMHSRPKDPWAGARKMLPTNALRQPQEKRVDPAAGSMAKARSDQRT
jgi:hypothetical protein